MMTVDGVTVCQSFSMARWLAREFDLYGKNSAEAAQIDMIVDTVGDLINSENKCAFIIFDIKKIDSFQSPL